jgi:hypothetical protein
MCKLSSSWVDVPIFYVLLFGVVYLASCDFAMDPIKEQECVSNGDLGVQERKHKTYTDV